MKLKHTKELTASRLALRMAKASSPALAAASLGRPISASTAIVRVAIAGLMVCLTGPLFAGMVFVDLVEDGGGAGIITATVSGSLDFVTGADNTASYSNGINPIGGTIGFGLTGALTRSWYADGSLASQSATPPPAGSVFAPFGTGSFAPNVLTNVSGNPLFLYTNGLQVDRSYVSGNPLSASATLSGDFQSTGITPGTATTQFTLDGQANTLTVRATAVAVPEPSSFALMGIAGLAFAGYRRRKAADYYC